MRFLKEYLGFFFIIFFIIGSDFFISNVTEKSIKEFEKNIDSISKMILQEGYDKENLKQKVNELEKQWEKSEATLSYFAEHNELEKVSLDIVNVKSNLKLNKIDEVYEKVEELKFNIEHIKNKQKFKLNNMF